MSLGLYLRRMHSSCKVRSHTKVTTINQAMGIGGSCESAKQWPWGAQCRCGMLFKMQGMLKLREELNTLQTGEGGREESYESSRTPFWKKYIEVRLFRRTSQLGSLWAAKWPSRRFLTSLSHFILLRKHRSSSMVSLLLEHIHLHRRLQDSPPSQPGRRDIIRIGRTSAR